MNISFRDRGNIELGTHTLWPAEEHELAQMQRFNQKLAWMPRFRIRNRVTPRVIQALLRSSQMVAGNKLLKHGPVSYTHLTLPTNSRV